MTEPPAENAPNRRERKKQATRAAIEDAALRLFAEKGYDHTTVEDIAEAADIAVRTFFRYYSSKQHVLFGDVALDIAGRLRTALVARPATEPPVAAIRAALDGLEFSGNEPEQLRQIALRLQVAEQHPTLFANYLALMVELADVVADFVAQRTGAAVTDLHPLLVANATTGALLSAVRAWQSGDGRSLDELRHEAFDTLTAGLSGG